MYNDKCFAQKYKGLILDVEGRGWLYNSNYSALYMQLTFIMLTFSLDTKEFKYYIKLAVNLSSNLNAIFPQLIIILNFGILHYHWYDPFQMFSNPVACLATATQHSLLIIIITKY